VADQRGDSGQQTDEFTAEPSPSSAAAKPLATSSSATPRAILKPAVRQTFAAPVLPLPSLRMLTPFSSRGSQ